jgi:hypothetical protein
MVDYVICEFRVQIWKQFVNGRDNVVQTLPNCE